MFVETETGQVWNPSTFRRRYFEKIHHGTMGFFGGYVSLTKEDKPKYNSPNYKIEKLPHVADTRPNKYNRRPLGKR